MKKNKILLLALLGLSVFTIAHSQKYSLVYLSQLSGIRGTVLTETGSPSPAVQVQLLQGSRLIKTTTTLEDGSFLFDSLQASKYEISFKKTGFKPMKKELLLAYKEYKKETYILFKNEIEKELSSLKLEDSYKKTSKTDGYAERKMSVTMDYAPSMSISRGELSAKPYSSSFTVKGTGNDLSFSGLLTAGETKDFNKWNLWEDLTTGEMKEYAKLWGIVPNKRYTVQLLNKTNLPLVDKEVQLKDENNNLIFEARTDNTGKAELWLSIENMETQYQNAKLKIEIEVDGKKHTIKRIKEFTQGINTLKINEACNQSNVVDILFTVDATGSMGDEIRYLKSDMDNLITSLQTTNPTLQFNMGSVFYRDKTDEYLVRTLPFTKDKTSFLNFINNQEANGGGDFPEAVDDALEASINTMNWSENARTRILFLLLDAPPHEDIETIKRMQRLTAMAARKNIRIVPVGCSGINKSTEYLMRAVALATNGKYVFLTDHSGIGNPHIKASTDEYKVETLNDILIRTISEFTFIPSCENTTRKEVTLDTLVVTSPRIIDHVILDSSILHNKDSVLKDTITEIEIPKDTVQDLIFKAYPNPTNGPLTIEVSKDIKTIYLSDFTGKLLTIHHFTPGETKITLQLNHYPSGTYLVKAWQNEKWVYGKIVLTNRPINN